MTSSRSGCICRQGEWGDISLLSSWCLGITAFTSVEGGRGLCLGGCYVQTKAHAANLLQPTAFLDGCSKVEMAKLGKARFIPFPPTYDELSSIAPENSVNPCKWLWFDSFYFYPDIMWKVQGTKHWIIVTMITSPLKELDFFVFQATFEIWKGILSISVTKKKTNTFLFDAKIKHFQRLFDVQDRQAGRFWRRRRSCLQQLPALFLNLTPQT